MGCTCSKATPCPAVDNRDEKAEQRLPNTTLAMANLLPSRTPSLRRGKFNYRFKDLSDDHPRNVRRLILKDEQFPGSAGLHGERSFLRKNREMVEHVTDHPWAGMVPRAAEGEHIAAGWPPWLVAAASEAVKGWVPRKASSFEKLDKIGQGTYSRVYRARDLEVGKLVALKKVRFDSLDPESVSFMAREIHILRRLDHPNVIKLEGLITSQMSCSLYLIFEYMEHDLTGLASRPGLKFTEPQIKCYMKQLLLGLDHCHSRSVLHRDIKGSNLLIDNNGVLKIADFGLASFHNPHQRQQLTSRVVTLWYRPPELLLGATHYGAAVDVWSTGCILAELYAAKPIMPGRTEVEQLHKIFKLCGSPTEEYWSTSKLSHATVFKPQQPYKRCVAETFKDFPAPALALVERLLSFDPADRGSAASALKSEFFTTRPLPCNPSSLPKFPPSKEFDANLQVALERDDHGKRGSQESLTAAAVAPEEDPISTTLSPLSVHDTINDRNGNMMPNRASHSGPLANPPAWPKAGKSIKDAPRRIGLNDISGMLSDTVSARTMMSEDRMGTTTHPLRHGLKPISRFPGVVKSTVNYGRVERGAKRSGNDPVLVSHHGVQVGYGSKVNQMQHSGPLLVRSSKVDQMLKDHDLRIQEAVRRARVDRVKPRRVLLQGDGNDHRVGRNSLLASRG